MPIYEYQCKKCGHHFDLYRLFWQNDQEVKCPECGQKAPERLFSKFSTTDASCSSG
jgi:putative FmdB family regulatory protein